MGNRAIRYLVFLATLLVGGPFPAFAQLRPPIPLPAIVKAGTGTGTVTTALIWPTEGTRRFVPSYAVLTAIPDADSIFAGWNRGCGSNNSCKISWPWSGVTVTATFNLRIELTVDRAGNGTGTVTSDVGQIQCGATCVALYSNPTAVTLTAKADPGQSFAGWTGGCTGTGTCLITVTNMMTVTATFMDSIKPDTGIDRGPSDPSGDGRPTFAFSSTEQGSTFRCQLDGSTFRICESPHTVSVGNGPHTFAVFAVDAGGNADPTPATYSWTIAAATVDLNQHGLTGSWYEPASSGQGIAVEVFPDRSSGRGRVFVSWFTFDTVMGGAERQRWYTAEGEVVTGQSNALLTLYQNTGGNFDAPPATSAQAVGTAMLDFATCSSGTLSYMFSDGSGRAGVIPLTRVLPNVTCSVTDTYPTHEDFALSGNWYAGAATSGQGFVTEVAPNASVFFLSWFTYMPDGANAGAAGQRWYTAQGAFALGSRAIPVQIYETTGGKFDTWTPLGQQTVPVGTGTMTFLSCGAATFSYAFTGGSSGGKSGTIALSRVGPIPPGCTEPINPRRRLVMAPPNPSRGATLSSVGRVAAT